MGHASWDKGPKEYQQKYIKQITVVRKRIYCFHISTAYIFGLWFLVTWWWTFLQTSCCFLPEEFDFSFCFWLKGNMHLCFCLCITIFHFWLGSEYKTRRWRINLAQVLYYIILAWVKEAQVHVHHHLVFEIYGNWWLSLFIKAFFMYQTFSYFHKEHLTALEKELDNFSYGREHVEQSSSFPFDNFV